ncbi:hypothetical protein FJU30_22660 [Affinibrenneria salicis]|uniref:Uncharacterized protein n=1 Tax=Affinibrenneria salicis TaxID=2590031 RepID=A0A5J5FS93_9GAMM|nr:SiaB family protein kinase [Affinibrenneria salicis]KAA8996167.1 hypothetical protein FJU30_22660 [Affinibrenneria salicis]
MPSDNPYAEIFSATRQRDITLYYVGYFSQNIISSLAETLRLQFEKQQIPPGVRRRVFSTFIEVVQNITRYSADRLTAADQTDEVRHGSVCMSQHDGKYVLLCANPVQAQDIERLRSHLEPLSTMSQAEIKRAWQASLRDETPAWSKGADIGLLTVARDASEPLAFTFHANAVSGLSTFSLKVII